MKEGLVTVGPVEVVKRFYDGLNAHDTNAVVACLKPGGTWNCPAVTNTNDATDIASNAIAVIVQSLIAAFPGLKFEVGSIRRLGLNGSFFGESGPDVLIGTVWVMSGTHGGVFRGLAATGTQFSLMGTDIFRIEGKRISCMDGVWDSAAVRDYSPSAPKSKAKKGEEVSDTHRSAFGVPRRRCRRKLQLRRCA